MSRARLTANRAAAAVSRRGRTPSTNTTSRPTLRVRSGRKWLISSRAGHHGARKPAMVAAVPRLRPTTTRHDDTMRKTSHHNQTGTKILHERRLRSGYCIEKGNLPLPAQRAAGATSRTPLDCTEGTSVRSKHEK
jgi:hypothetical protein